MPRIIPDVLQRLRTAKGWSLDDLAERTKPKIDKQTIHRIEKGAQRGTRDTTIRRLAKALSVAPTVLTGETSAPDTPDDDGKYFLMSKLGFRISTSAYNALFLAAERFNVTHSEIVELAPFLFCWAAEASLQRRRDHLRQAELACEHARQLESEMRHLVPPDFTASEEKIAAERESIEQEDLFALSLDYHSVPSDWTDNPFTLFLDSLTKDMSEGTAFEGYSFHDFPQYRICTEQAKTYTDGDTDLAEQIMEGHVALNDMPRDIRNWQERAQWIRGKVQDFRNEMSRLIEESISRGASR
jgi:transcriptional regulator with XRE-family HTH domain